MMQNLLMPNIAKLDVTETGDLNLLIMEQEYLINANGYLESSRVIKEIREAISEEGDSVDELNDVLVIIADSLNHIQRIEFIGSCVSDIVAGLSTPNQCIIKYLSKFGDWANA